MFRHLIMAIFRLYMKYLVSSYTRLIWAVYSGEVGEVRTRARMCDRGWVGWVHGGVGTAKLRNATFTFAMCVRPSFHLSAWNDSSLTGRISMKFKYFSKICPLNF